MFRSEHVTEGKITIDEDHSTPIFSPYAGRVTKLLVKPGDAVTVGQPLFTVEATDIVQAQIDFISAATALNKARSTLNLAQINDKRQRGLYEGKAVPLKEVRNARAALHKSHPGDGDSLLARSVRDFARASELVVAAIGTIIALCGTAGFATSHPIQRAWRDIHLASMHISLNTETNYAHFWSYGTRPWAAKLMLPGG